MRAVWSSVTQPSMEPHFGASFQEIMKKKNGSPLKKRADFQNYSPREPYWLSFFLSVCFDDAMTWRSNIKHISHAWQIKKRHRMTG